MLRSSLDAHFAIVCARTLFLTRNGLHTTTNLFGEDDLPTDMENPFNEATETTDQDMPVRMRNPFQSTIPRCTLCGVPVDYKNVQLLSQFVSSMSGLQFPQKSTNLCDRKYKEVTRAIRLSRYAGFMPYSYKESAFLEDPVLAYGFMDKLSDFAGDINTGEEKSS